MDSSILKVADAEFRRLATGMRPGELYDKVYVALDALGGLQRGVPPDYDDPWVALFYLTWYQPGQINLSRLLIETMRQKRVSNTLMIENSSHLRVVDFGCGALAMLFAILWTATEALERGEKIDSIDVSFYDTAISMIILGVNLWNAFKLEIQARAGLQGVSHCSEKIIRLQYEQPESLLSQKDHRQDEERWLGAIHTVYESNWVEIKTGLARIVDQLRPAVGFMSCRALPRPKLFLRQASPFDVLQYLCTESNMDAQIVDSLPRISRWRKCLDETLRSHGFNGHPFLRRSVTWEFPRASSTVSSYF